MNTIQQCKDLVARKHKYADFDDMLLYNIEDDGYIHTIKINKIIDEAIELYVSQFQQSKEIELPSDKEIELEFAVHGHYDDEANERQLAKQEAAIWMREEIRRRNNKQ